MIAEDSGLAAVQRLLGAAVAERELAQGPRSYANEVPPGMEAATDQVVEMLVDQVVLVDRNAVYVSGEGERE